MCWSLEARGGRLGRSASEFSWPKERVNSDTYSDRAMERTNHPFSEHGGRSRYLRVHFG